MIFRRKLIYHGIAEIFDAKYIGAKTIGYTLPPGIYDLVI